MGRAGNGLMGNYQGKIGNLVFYVLNGRQMVRSIGKITSAPTEAQLRNRKEMATVIAFLKPITEFINVGFMVAANKTGKSAANMAVSYNKKNAVGGTYPDIGMEYHKVRVAEGKGYEAESPTVELLTEGLKFTWLCPNIYPWPVETDQVMLLTYFPLLKKAFYITAGVQRKECSQVLYLPQDMLAQHMELYISFVAANRKSVANSTYIGSLNL